MKKKLLIISINVFLMIIFLVCQGISAGIIAQLHPGLAADAWTGQSGERFAQLAAYFPESYGFNEKSVYDTRSSIEASLLTVSLEDSGNRRLYADAWSAQGTVSVTGLRGASTATAIGVGGDYFLFHPLYLRSGSYISQNDLMRDRVVLDEQMAWRLFGSVQLAGLDVLINNRHFVIAGVVARESASAYKHAMSLDSAHEAGTGLFMSFEALDALIKEAASEDSETNKGAWISSYEIVMPDVVSNFAVDALTSALDKPSGKALDSCLIIDNTHRFSYTNIFNLIGSFGNRSLRTDAISLPYWENAVRYAEDWLALLLGISLIVMVCPAVFAVLYGTRLIRFGIKKGMEILRAYLNKREDRKYAVYMQRRGNRGAARGRHEMRRDTL